MDADALKRDDPEVADLVAAEHRRRSESLDLIASENLCPRAVHEATATLLTDKYAEGYPGHRWYGGCEVVDQVEQLAIRRGKDLFGCEHINVQPHSGSQANMAVYFAALEPGQPILSMDLAHGGHLTHGMDANFSGRMYHIVHYGVSAETERIDYGALAAQAREVRPAMIVGGASSYPRAVEVDRLAEIAHDVGAYLMIDMAHFAGLVVGGVHPDPVPVADFVTATTHKTLRGPRGGLVMCKGNWARRIDHMVFPGIQGGPLMHLIAGKAVAFALAGTEAFRSYQRQVVANCRAMADELASLGHRLVSGGTDTHLMLVDLRPKKLTGKAAEIALGRANITCNKNGVPFDPEKPMVTSGIRLGSPAGTTRGFGIAEFQSIGGMIIEVLDGLAANGDEGNKAVEQSVKQRAIALCERFPIYR